jgi:hypothetical protein
MAFQRERPAIVWKLFDESAVPPTFPHQHYRFVPGQGKVAIDLFWGRSCLTADTEAQTVRECVKGMGDSVLLREHCANDPNIPARYGFFRAVL